MTFLSVANAIPDGATGAERPTSKAKAYVQRSSNGIRWHTLTPERYEVMPPARVSLEAMSVHAAGAGEFRGKGSDARRALAMNGHHQRSVRAFATWRRKATLLNPWRWGASGINNTVDAYQQRFPTSLLACEEGSGESSLFPLKVSQRQKKDPATSTMIRLLAYNIKHGRGNDGRVDLQRTADVIRRVRADVVALQEVDEKVERSGQLNQAKRLAELTGLSYHAFGSFFDYQGGEYGMAIISRYPLRDIKRLRLPDGAEPRASLVVTVAAGKSFRLANVHFYRDERERLAQAQVLLKYLQNEKLPCVIAGDFNSRPESAVLKRFSKWNIPAKGEDHLTFPSDRPRVEIDFLMFRPENAFVVNEIDVVEEPLASDHRPVLMEVSFGESAE